MHDPVKHLIAADAEQLMMEFVILLNQFRKHPALTVKFLERQIFLQFCKIFSGDVITAVHGDFLLQRHSQKPGLPHKIHINQ